MLFNDENNSVATLQWNKSQGFHLSSFDGHNFRDRWGHIHARHMHPAFYDPLRMQPSAVGIEYLLPIFSNAIGPDDMEHVRQTLFDAGNLYRPYHSVNTDINKRIRYLEK
jgi:6-phosphofructokinase 1